MRCAVFGVGSRYVFVVDEVLRRLGWEVAAYVANRSDAPRPDELDPVVEASDLPSGLTDLPAVVAVGYPDNRRVAVSEARKLGFSEFPAVMDPSSIVADSATVDSGVFMGRAVLIAAGASVGSFANLNQGAQVGHHSTLGEFAFLGPGAIICGAVKVERGALIGAGAIVNPDITIGQNSVVGSGSVVIRDVPPHARVVGNPTRVIGDSMPGSGDVSA